MSFNRHSRGDSIYTYGTPGVAAQFIGSDSEVGKMVLHLFKGFAQGMCSEGC